jgi:hypothetical protein
MAILEIIPLCHRLKLFLLCSHRLSSLTVTARRQGMRLRELGPAFPPGLGERRWTPRTRHRNHHPLPCVRFAGHTSCEAAGVSNDLTGVPMHRGRHWFNCYFKMSWRKTSVTRSLFVQRDERENLVTSSHGRCFSLAEVDLQLARRLELSDRTVASASAANSRPRATARASTVRKLAMEVSQASGRREPMPRFPDSSCNSYVGT